MVPAVESADCYGGRSWSTNHLFHPQRLGKRATCYLKSYFGLDLAVVTLWRTSRRELWMQVGLIVQAIAVLKERFAEALDVEAPGPRSQPR